MQLWAECPDFLRKTESSAIEQPFKNHAGQDGRCLRLPRAFFCVLSWPFDTLVPSGRPLVRHLLRKIRVRADAERTRRSSSVSCLFSHPSCARWCVLVHEAVAGLKARLALTQPSAAWQRTTSQPPGCLWDLQLLHVHTILQKYQC